VARVTGLIVSTFPTVYPGPLHYHFLEKEKNASITINSVLSSKHEVLSASDRGIELVDVFFAIASIAFECVPPM
jgi:hypothetical protein